MSLLDGILMVPQKHMQASKFISSSGLYIITNIYPGVVKGLDGQEASKDLLNEIFKAQR